MSDDDKPTGPVHPVQRAWRYHPSDGAHLNTLVTMRAYEVYCHVYAPQEAMVTGDCRGGFHINELVGFLYARSFPKSEWRARVDEAFKDMKL